MKKKRIIALWKGGVWQHRDIETETCLHEDRPNKILLPLEGSNKVIIDYSFTLSGISGTYWVYAQD